MSEPAMSCPFCAQIVPSTKAEEHMKNHDGPEQNNSEEAHILDNGHDDYE